jgi:hypothetical protein
MPSLLVTELATYPKNRVSVNRMPKVTATHLHETAVLLFMKQRPPMFVYGFQSSISKRNVLRISLLQLASLQISFFFSSNKKHLQICVGTVRQELAFDFIFRGVQPSVVMVKEIYKKEMEILSLRQRKTLSNF